MRSHRIRCLSVIVVLAGFTAAVSAQTVRSGRITGTITDATGGALPGVTVTLSSPALLVPQVIAVSDSQGAYQFVDLPPGTFRLVYELSGFNSLVREDIRITAGFTARVDVTIGLANVEETVTVSGQSPLIDVVNTRGGASVSGDLLAATPNNLNYQDLYLHVGGVQIMGPPLTGESGLAPLAANMRPKTYGQTGVRVFNTVEGIVVEPNESPDFSSVDEVDVKTFGNTAEVGAPGVATQLIVKSGGNEFHGRYTERFQHHTIQSSNIDDALRAQGVTEGNAIRYWNEFSADLGGPLLRDRLWFYGAFHDLRNERTAPGYSSDAGPDGVYGTIDDTPGRLPGSTQNATVKVTYQASNEHKFIGFWSRNPVVDDGSGASRFTPAESTYELIQTSRQAKVEWQGLFSNDFYAHNMFADSGLAAERAVQTFAESIPNRLDRDAGFETGASFNDLIGVRRPWRKQLSGSLNYFPRGTLFGSHEIAAGYALWWGEFETSFPSQVNGNYRLVYDRVGDLSNQPVELHAHNYPVAGGSRQNLYSAYVSDNWRASNRVTVNLGLRFERNVAYVDEQVKVQGIFGNAGTFSKIEVGAWNGLAPRVGIAFDASGNGTTVVKASYGWYNHDWNYDFAHAYNQNNVSTIVYRWSDPDGNDDYTPGEVDLDPDGPDFLSASGATNNVINPNLDLAHSHEVAASVEQELAGAFSVRGLYVYKRAVGQLATVNSLRPRDVYNQVFARRDPGPDGRLDTGDDGGTITFYDYDPAYGGSSFLANLRVNADRDDTFHNVEVTINRRQTGRWYAYTSFLLTKNHRWLSLVSESPNDDLFPLDDTWDVAYRLAAGYDLPAGVNVSMLYQAYNGEPGQRTYRFGVVDPDGGPSLPSSGSVNLRVEPFGERRGDPRHIMNFRAAKVFAVGDGQLRGEVDLLNAFNSNVAWGQFWYGGSGINYASGPTFGYVTRIVSPRTLRLGIAYEF